MRNANVLLSMLALLLLGGCRPAPETRESDAITPAVEACEGYLTDAMVSGERVQVGVAARGEFWTVDFLRGSIETQTGRVKGPAFVEVSDDKICTSGDITGDPCLSALWREGWCWSLGSKPDLTP